jgi:hypothetical protein
MDVIDCAHVTKFFCLVTNEVWHMHGSMYCHLSHFVHRLLKYSDRSYGFILSWFGRRSPTAVRVREAHVEKLGQVVDVEYEILNVLEFNR